MVVDLNADVGEWDSEPAPIDRDLIPLITSANVACGAHAGSEQVMAATIAIAAASGAAVGAHPGFDDRANFGRREMEIDPAAVFDLVYRQVAALAAVADAQGIRLSHVKPHGALYNMAARDPRLADAIARAVVAFDSRLALFGLAGSALVAAGRSAGLPTASEVFADRGYAADGSLVSRAVAGAVIVDPHLVVRRAVSLVRDRVVVAVDGSQVPVVPDTICIHGDTPGAVELARHVRRALETAGVRISAYR